MSREEFQKNFVGTDPFHMVEILSDGPEAAGALSDQSLGQQAREQNWQGQINDLNSKLTDLQSKVDELVKVQTIKDNEITRLNGELAKAGATIPTQPGDKPASVDITISQAIKILVQTIKDAIKG